MTDINRKYIVCSTFSTREKNEKSTCNFQVNLKVKNKLEEPKSRWQNSGHNVYSDCGLMVDFRELVVLYCGRVPVANAPECTAAEGLLYKPWSLVLPTCTAMCLHQRPW